MSEKDQRCAICGQRFDGALRAFLRHFGHNEPLWMHAADPDGNVWRVDYRTNGSPLLTTTTPDFGFHFNVGPGSYSMDAVTATNAANWPQ